MSPKVQDTEDALNQICTERVKSVNVGERGSDVNNIIIVDLTSQYE